MPKLHTTRLTFADIQRSEYSAKTPAEGAKMEFPGIGRERRASRAIGRGRDPRVRECVPKVPEFERGDLS